MRPVHSLVTLEELQRLATRSNFRYGQGIAEVGTITITAKNTFNVVAKVQYKNGEAKTAELHSTSKGLRWKCTCTSRKDVFCQHCVALGITVQKNLQ